MGSIDYHSFLATKLHEHKSCGIPYADVDFSMMFPHQDALTKWALRKGRAAIFADTGLGKTRMQIVWANAVSEHTKKRVLILAPLAVADQTVREASSIGIACVHAKDRVDIGDGISITNYDRLHRFDPDDFVGVVLDESSIIKHKDSKTLAILLESFRDTPYKLCATATPAPNDWMELGTHAQFLGICTQQEMLSEYFTHDGGETQKWRLKGHARDDFWRWVSSWGAMIRNPADLGFDGSLYDLPPLCVEQVTVDTEADADAGLLFPVDARTLMDRRRARRKSLFDRVSACADIVNSIDEPWIVWCELNDEGDALKSAIPGAVEIKGADTIDHKEKSLVQFANGDIRVMVTKPKIAGWGVNWQHCRRVAFVGVTDSWESYYQAVRRCWRFGQKRQVYVYLFVSDMEGAVSANLKRKEKDANAMYEQLSEETSSSIKEDVLGEEKIISTYKASERLLTPSFMSQ